MKKAFSLVIMLFVLFTVELHASGKNEAEIDLDYELVSASRNGYLEELERLLSEGADVNAKDSIGSTGLMLASEYGHTETVKLLIESGAELNYKNREYGWTALMLSSLKGRMETTEYLISVGSEIDTQDTDGWTALIWAVYWNRIEIVELLISNGADVTIKTTKQHDILSEEWPPGTTVLSMAAVLGREEIVQLLRNAGANE